MRHSLWSAPMRMRRIPYTAKISADIVCAVRIAAAKAGTTAGEIIEHALRDALSAAQIAEGQAPAQRLLSDAVAAGRLPREIASNGRSGTQNGRSEGSKRAGRQMELT